MQLNKMEGEAVRGWGGGVPSFLPSAVTLSGWSTTRKRQHTDAHSSPVVESREDDSERLAPITGVGDLLGGRNENEE